MNTLSRQIRTKIFSFLTTFMICTPVWADDTEIYFGGSTTTYIKPNVLFVLDTSSSMNRYDGAGDTTTRLEELKEAMNSILSTVQDVNIGIMRFTNPGGSILYPIADIDAVISSTSDDSATLTGSISSQVDASENDAEESATNTVSLNSLSLELNTVPTMESGSVDTSISYILDDAEERVSTGSVDATSSDLELMHEGGSREQIVGLRFQNININQGATITSAWLEFEVDKKHSGTLSARIYGEDTDSADSYKEETNNISNRTKTSASVLWTISDSPSPNQSLVSNDISPVIQEIVNRSGWTANNDMAVMLYHEAGSLSNYRELESRDGEASAAPILHIRYTQPSATAGAQTIGVRFEDINIPQGATITSASLSFTASGDESGSTSLQIYAEDTDNSAAFTENSGDISGRSRTTNYASWLSIPAWSDGTEYTSPDLTIVVQEVVDRSGWCGGGNMAFLITGSGLRNARSFDSSETGAPKLNITYNVPSTPGCFTREYSKTIADGNDDAEEYPSGTINLTSTDLELVDDTDDRGESKLGQTIGLRFNNVQLKQGVSLSRAYIEFAVDETDPTQATNLVIKAEDVDDSAAFSTASGNISSRTKTTASVNWTINDQWTTTHEIKRSPNIAPLLNEVLARGGWLPGNDLSFIISGTGKRTVESFDGSIVAPRLVYYAKDSEIGSGGDTVRDHLKRLVNQIEYKNGTPIVDALYEAAKYYRGEAVDYGKTRGTGSDDDKAKARVSDPLSYTGGTLYQPTGCSADNLGSTSCADESITGSPVYTSPITESCQENHIVLLTDGDPSITPDTSKIKALIGASSCADSDEKECGQDLVRFLAQEDQSGSLSNAQTITTHTIGFHHTDAWLESLSSKTNGGGIHGTADDTQKLINEFDAILRNILAVNTSFVEPSVTINQFNRFAHRDDVYFALFKPQETAKWFGNLKKYQLKGNPATLHDAHSPQQPAIDENTGFFSIGSQSFWSADEDGNNVERGGAASRLPSSRNVYTNVSSNAVLSVTENAVSESNVLLTKDLLSITSESDEYRTDLLKWARGLDENDALRLEMGDPLHSRPELITYDGVSSTIESTIFFGTNEGYLHAVDINTGVEQFAFIPKELLENLDTYYVNPSVSSRPYGLDGGLTVWTKDANKDGDLKDSGEFARLYTGMRRGGRNYYALDVTDVSNPELMWQITGGSGDFIDLGQTWSEPIKTKVYLHPGGNEDPILYDVLIFGGGYDPDQDNVSVRTTDDIGNAIYMVNAETGALLWSAGNHNGHNLTLSDMDYSIPSDVRVIDMNRDGIVDQLYVGDMGGQIWRIDINEEGSTADHLATGGVIADFGGSTAATNRRFYYPPDLALAVDGKDRYLSVAVGSGYRAHPLDTGVDDRFYMIKQVDTHAPPSSYSGYTESDLYDATDNLLQEGSTTEQDEAEIALSNTHTSRKHGWYIRMENSGEKVLAGSTTIQNQIVFTTYEPTPPASGSCNPAQGTSRAYLVSLFDATPMLDITGDNNVNKGDRVIQLQIGSIPATPTVIDTLDSKPTVWVGPERLDQVNTDVESIRTYWIEENN